MKPSKLSGLHNRLASCGTRLLTTKEVGSGLAQKDGVDRAPIVDADQPWAAGKEHSSKAQGPAVAEARVRPCARHTARAPT